MIAFVDIINLSPWVVSAINEGDIAFDSVLVLDDKDTIEDLLNAGVKGLIFDSNIGDWVELKLPESPGPETYCNYAIGEPDGLTDGFEVNDVPLLKVDPSDLLGMPKFPGDDDA